MAAEIPGDAKQPNNIYLFLMPVCSWRNTKSGNNKTRFLFRKEMKLHSQSATLAKTLLLKKKKNKIKHHRYFGGDFGEGTKFFAGGMSQPQSTVPPPGFHWKEQELEESKSKISYQTTQFYS